MGPTMTSNFVALPGSSRDDLRMFRHVFAEHEECDLDMMRSEDIE